MLVSLVSHRAQRHIPLHTVRHDCFWQNFLYLFFKYLYTDHQLNHLLHKTFLMTIIGFESDKIKSNFTLLILFFKYGSCISQYIHALTNSVLKLWWSASTCAAQGSNLTNMWYSLIALHLSLLPVCEQTLIPRVGSYRITYLLLYFAPGR